MKGFGPFTYLLRNIGSKPARFQLIHGHCAINGTESCPLEPVLATYNILPLKYKYSDELYLMVYLTFPLWNTLMLIRSFLDTEYWKDCSNVVLFRLPDEQKDWDEFICVLSRLRFRDTFEVPKVGRVSWLVNLWLMLKHTHFLIFRRL